MDFQTFEKGLSEIKAFFPTFKPSLELQDSWFSRLKQYKNDSFLKACSEITYTCSKAPSFPELLAKVKRHQLKYAKGEFWVYLSASAPMSDEKYELSKKAMEKLRLVLAKKLPAEKAIDWWLAEYPKLPNYASEAKIQMLVDTRNFDELNKLGVIEGTYQEGQTIGFLGVRQ